MSGARTIRAAAVTAIVTLLSLGAAQADTYLFTDTLRPGGVARSEAAFHADEHRALVRFVRRLHGYYGVVQLRPRSAERRALLLALQ